MSKASVGVDDAVELTTQQQQQQQLDNNILKVKNKTEHVIIEEFKVQETLTVKHTIQEDSDEKTLVEVLNIHTPIGKDKSSEIKITGHLKTNEILTEDTIHIAEDKISIDNKNRERPETNTPQRQRPKVSTVNNQEGNTSTVNQETIEHILTRGENIQNQGRLLASDTIDGEQTTSTDDINNQERERLFRDTLGGQQFTINNNESCHRQNIISQDDNDSIEEKALVTQEKHSLDVKSSTKSDTECLTAVTVNHRDDTVTSTTNIKGIVHPFDLQYLELQEGEYLRSREGLFTRRCSKQILEDARLILHLQETTLRHSDINIDGDGVIGCYVTNGDSIGYNHMTVVDKEKQKVLQLIEYYNKHSNVLDEPFKITIMDEDLDYEGALRFYFEDGKSELTKAVRITNRTSTEELIPKLVDKFSLPTDKQYALYEVTEEEEIFQTVILDPNECPLAKAISAKKVPRFVLRSKDENSNFVEVEETVTKKRRKLFSFSKKDSSEGGEKEKKKSSKNKNKHDKSSVVAVEVSPLENDHIAVVESSDDNLNLEDPFDEIEADEDTVKSDNGEGHYENIDDLNIKLDGESLIEKQNSINLDSDNEEKFDSPLLERRLEPEEAAAENFKSTEAASVETPDNQDPSEEGDEEEETNPEYLVPDLPNLPHPDHKRTLSFSNSSLFFDQDNNNEPPSFLKRKFLRRKDKEEKKKKTKSDKNKGDKEKAEKGKSENRTRLRSIKEMVRGNKKKDTSDDSASATELSTYKLAPGILKVFGDHVSEGSNYKAVRASTISTSQEVVRMALERYGLENCNPKDFVLCDVVGQFSPAEQLKKKGSKKSEKNTETENSEPEEPKWITEYVRVINDNEKPLVLQSLWKPTNGRSRRFELRKRHEVESSCFYINTADTMGRSPSETSLFDDSEHSSVGNEEKQEYTPLQMSPHSKSNKLAGQRQDESANRAPQFCPYLLLINGSKPCDDQIIHKLEDPTVVVGSYVEDEIKQCNVVLYSSDILLPHCWIYKKVKLEDDSSETNLDEINFLVFVEPASGAEITVNGTPVSTTTLLKPGHLVSFGKNYVFVFKDPTQRNEIERSKLAWWDILVEKQSALQAAAASVVQSLEHTAIKKSVGVQAELIRQSISESPEHSEGSDDDEDELDESKHARGSSNLAPRKQVEKSTLQLEYNIKDEEELLHSIIEIADQELGAFKLTPAYFLMMTIEHSAATFTEIQTRKLLLKMCNGLQGIAWEKTKEIGKQSSVKTEDPAALLTRVLHELRPVFLWMASSLEMLHFLQSRLNTYLLHKDDVTTSKEALLSADDELLTVLEEVIMFTFQQTVYHLTKVLYIALPAIIDSNPFQDTDDSERGGSVKAVHPSVANIPKIFQQILNTANEFQVHPQIVSQLFAYLFFFANASLFNALMERGPGGKFYRWTKGVQMRGNLDLLEDWAQANGLQSPFEQYLGKFRNAVDLLSTPKVQLLQFEWKEMRANNPALSPAQLQQLLSEYQLSGKPKPHGWYPPPEEVQPALRQSDVLESFATHPPLMLPSNNFLLSLDKAPSSEEFIRYLSNLKSKFSVEKKKGTAHIEPLKEGEEELLKPSLIKEAKSKKVRTKSSIDEGDLTAAIQLKNEKNSENSSALPLTASPAAATVTETIGKTPGETQAQVGSIKSIQVQSKKTVTKISTPSSLSTNGDPVNGYAGNYLEPEEVDNLINKAPSLIDSNDLPDNYNGDKDDVYVASLDRGETGLGLGLIDGMFTTLNNNGIYIRTIVPDTPASEDKRLRVGDRILAVNGNTLVGADYNKAMGVIMKAGSRLSFLIAKSEDDVMEKVLASSP